MSIFATDYLKQQAPFLSDELIQIRRILHAHPELGTHEQETGALILGYLQEWGIPFCYPVADTGIVATVTGRPHKEEEAKHAPSSGAAAADLPPAFSSPAHLCPAHPHSPVVAVRADIDALPLQEDKSRPYCSLHDGVMHACGHDAHTAIALGVAHYLKLHETEWEGTVKFFFQPAEETCGGAARMIGEGCMEDPKVDYVIGLHVMPHIDFGQVELRYQDLNAASDELTILLHGTSAHCASPEEAVDTIVMSAAVILNLQTIVSRNLSPFKTAVLSLGTIEGGHAHNIIADQVKIRGALRTTDPQTRKLFHDRIRTVVEETCRACGGRGELIVTPGYDALVNDDRIVDVVREAAARRLGAENIHLKSAPSLGVEDFSFFLNHAPGAFYHLGCGCKEKGITAPLHNPGFDIDERALALGFELQTAIVGRLLQMGAAKAGTV